MEYSKEIAKAITSIKQKEPAHIQFSKDSKLVLKRITPLLLVYRIPTLGKDQMLSALAKSEACYLVGKESELDFTKIVSPIVRQLIDEYGACQLIELWQEDDMETDVAIHIAQKTALAIADKFIKDLKSNDLQLPLSIALKKDSKLPKPFDAKPLVNPLMDEFKQLLYMGIAIKPQYIELKTGKPYPLILRSYRDTFTRSLRKSFLEFVRLHTSLKVSQFRMLSTTELQPLVWEIDKSLASESQRFDFLLLVSPLNTQEAWLQFKKDKFLKTPKFRYRPMPIDPELVKRNLYNLRIEDLDDPTIAYLFRDKRKELDAMMTMLIDRGNEGFMHGSLQVFGNVNDHLLETAKAILIVYENNQQRSPHNNEFLNATEFAKLAKDELHYLRQQLPSLETGVRIREDISGIMVNRGVLNISKHYEIERSRAVALIQHEVGTHIVTYFNGKSQPFKLFSLGVPGYEQLQEGLAVFAEYMVGELTRDRLRIIAARVIAVHHMLAGHKFPDTFFLLVDQYSFNEETAFHITTRVYRGGGLTKDALYLKGLLGIIQYIREGRDLASLLIGKIREDYIPIVEELTLRGLILPPVLRPRYLSEPYLHSIDQIKKGGNIFNLSNS
ncbi:flavohemoglobin expression-modulating QEGLA motif protein [Sphingobacterium sp. SYP-B4668]|uniref:flavohemoglobin expression-modulating QEGLA motif protein n=1 Tax=Sphingobacterium sp. SYP-B4668 TaxID=2996035 RepID=UPI0022DDD8B2|nr:tyrosine/phenylalanine carboxypeptidase domain-containing protein [Sphingobacterium sp. SYP-B4668]